MDPDANQNPCNFSQSVIKNEARKLTRKLELALVGFDGQGGRPLAATGSQLTTIGGHRGPVRPWRAGVFEEGPSLWLPDIYRYIYIYIYMCLHWGFRVRSMLFRLSVVVHHLILLSSIFGARSQTERHPIERVHGKMEKPARANITPTQVPRKARNLWGSKCKTRGL
jgi:hypothetical protein